MPKVVDHDERRREIVEALFRVAERDGLGAASVRAVAVEAGIPAPRVQYYFRTKAELLDAAMTELGRVLVGRGIELQLAAGPDAPPEALLRAALVGARPVDEESRRATLLFFLFAIDALTAEGAAESQLPRSQRFIADYFADLISQAQERGEADPTLDPLHEARLILFANTGLNLGVLAGIHSMDEATAAMEHHLQRVFVQKRRKRPR